jgi:hypothetical protein
MSISDFTPDKQIFICISEKHVPFISVKSNAHIYSLKWEQWDVEQ